MKKIGHIILSFFLIVATNAFNPTPTQALDVSPKLIQDAEVLQDGSIALLYVQDTQIKLGIYTPETHMFRSSTIANGKAAALAKGQDQSLHVAFISLTDDLGYTYYHLSSWSAIEYIDSLNFNDVQGILSSPDIAVDTNGKAHITYMDSKGGYTSGNDYSAYDKDDLMYATNVSGAFTKTVISYSHGWFYSPDGWRNLVTAPPKIALKNNEFRIAVKQYNYDKWSATQYHDHSFVIFAQNPDQNLSNIYRSSTTNNDLGFKLFSLDASSSDVFALYKLNNQINIAAGTTIIDASRQSFTGSAADLFVTSTDQLYYAAIEATSLTLYQQGTLKPNIMLPAAISTTHTAMSTVVIGDKQYIFYNDTAGNLWSTFVSTNQAISETEDNYMIPDKIMVEISGISISSKTYDQVAASPTGIPIATTLDTQELVSPSGYDLTFYDSDNATVDTPIDVGDYRLVVSIEAEDPMYTGTLVIPFSITKKPVSIVGFHANERSYDGTTTVTLHNSGLSGVLSGDDVTVNMPATGTVSTKDVGIDKPVSYTPLSLSGSDAYNYELANTTPVVTATITKAHLILVEVDVTDKMYDGTTSAYLTDITWAGLAPADTLAVGTDIDVTANFLDANVGVSKPVNGTIALLSSPTANNYTLTDGSFTSSARIFKSPFLFATYSQSLKMTKGMVASYEFDLRTIELNHTDANVISFGRENLIMDVSNPIFNVTPELRSDGYTMHYRSSGATEGTASIDIRITSQNYEDAVVTLDFELVDKTPVTISGINVSSKQYDGGQSAMEGSPVFKIQGTETVVSASWGMQWFNTDTSTLLNEAPIRVGNYALRVYVTDDTVLYTGELIIPFEITPMPLQIINYKALTRDYDGTNVVDMTSGQILYKLTTDDVTLVLPATGIIDNPNAGTGRQVTVQPVTLSGPDASNYEVIQPTGMTVTIYKKYIQIEDIDIASKVYDGTIAADVTGARFNGLLGSETLTINTDYTYSATFDSSEANANARVTGKLILLESILSNNYLIEQDGQFEIFGVIEKADFTTVSYENSLQIANGLAYNYTFDLRNIYTVPSDVGEMTFALGGVLFPELFEVQPTILSDGYTLSFKSKGLYNEDATIEILVSSTNYHDHHAFIDVISVDRVEVDLSGIILEYKVYDGLPINIIGEVIATIKDTTTIVTPVGFDFWWQIADNKSLFKEAPKDVGVYYLYISVKDDDPNYIGSESIRVEITKKGLTIKPKDMTIQRFDDLPSPTHDAIGLIDGEILDQVVAFSEAPVIHYMSGSDDILLNSNLYGNYPASFTNRPMVTSRNYDVMLTDGLLTILPNDVLIETDDTNDQFILLGADINDLFDIDEMNDPKLVRLWLKMMQVEQDLSSTLPNVVTNFLKQNRMKLLIGYGLSIVKMMTFEDQSQVEEKLENEEIISDLTLRLLIPINLRQKQNLKVIFIDDDGNAKVIQSTRIRIRDDHYLEFKTNHFSTYAIVEVEDENQLPDTSQSTQQPWFFLLTGLLLLLITNKKKKEED